MTDKPESNQLQVIVRDSGLEEAKAKLIMQQFADYAAIAADWESKAKTIVVDNDSQLAEMAMARTGRLFLRDKRTAIERTRKALKEQALREGKAIDSISKYLTALIEPIETYLDAQEHFTAIRQAKEAQEKARIEEQRRIEEEQRLEAEAAAKAKAQAEENERIRKENEKLRNDALKREQAEAERKRQEFLDKRKEENRLRLEREEADRKVREEREKNEAEAEKVRRELAARDAILRKEREDLAKRIEKQKQEEAKKAEEPRRVVSKYQHVCPKCKHAFTDDDEN